jgi:hypothetical protein
MARKVDVGVGEGAVDEDEEANAAHPDRYGYPHGQGGRRVWIKIYEVHAWLGRQGWELLGSHVEAYVDPAAAGTAAEEGRPDKGICDVHTYIKGMDGRCKTGGVALQTRKKVKKV